MVHMTLVKHPRLVDSSCGPRLVESSCGSAEARAQGTLWCQGFRVAWGSCGRRFGGVQEGYGGGGGGGGGGGDMR